MGQVDEALLHAVAPLLVVLVDGIFAFLASAVTSVIGSIAGRSRRPGGSGTIRLAVVGLIVNGPIAFVAISALAMLPAKVTDTTAPTMRCFVYEYMTATGRGRDPASPEHGMYLEGRAMRDALAEDFEQVYGEEVFAFPDEAAPVEAEGFWSVCRLADWTLIIAPETDEILAGEARSVELNRGRLLGSARAAIELTSDKLALAEHWREHNVPTPATTDREPIACEAFPVVWKPRDGAGSTDTFLIRDRFELATALAARDPARPMILQEFVPGRAASVAFLCGPRESVPLVPTFQWLSEDGRFKYEGGELPIPPDLAERAVKLASRAVACVPGLMGYVGVDLVLGDSADGSRDYAIEINPRLTTSYIGLRALAAFNIAEMMLKVATGEAIGEPKWKPGRVRFGPDGAVEWR